MAVTVTLALNIQSDRADEFETYLGSILPDTRAFQGCNHVAVHRDVADPAQFLLYEFWNSAEDQQKYLGWRTENGTMATIGSYLAAPPVITYYTDSNI